VCLAFGAYLPCLHSYGRLHFYEGLFDRNGKEKNDFAATFPYELVHQGVSAELVADKYGITRAECDKFAGECPLNPKLWKKL